MDKIKISVSGNIAVVAEKPKRITSGTTGLPVEFTFDSEWDELRKVAVFDSCCVRKDMIIKDGATVVPIENLAKPGAWLCIGVYGVNEDGSVAIPTIWANVGMIYPGAVPEGDIGTDVGLAKEQYDAALLAADRAEAAASKAETDAGSVYEATERAEASASKAETNAYLANDAVFRADAAMVSAVSASESAQQSAQNASASEEYIDIQKYKIDQSVAEAKNAQHYAEVAQNKAETAAERAEISSRNYELIEKVTVTEEVSNITRTQEPDGTPYNLAGCIIRATIPPADGKSGNAVIHYTLAPGKALTGYMIAPVSATATLIGFSRAWTDHDRWMTGWWTCRAGAGEFATYYENPYYQGMYGENDGYMSKLEIVYSSKFPVGTVIEIWGVRV